MTGSGILRWTVLAAASAAVMACGAQPASTGRDEPAELDHSGLTVQQLSGELLYTDTILGMVGSMAVLDDRLVVVDVFGDSAIHVLRRADGRRLLHFGRRGQGPGEFEGPWAVDPVPGRDDAFWVFDPALPRLTLVELASADGPYTAEVFVHLGATATVLDAVWIDGELISTGFFADGRLGRFDAEGNQIATFGEIPQTDQDLPPAVRQNAYHGRMQANPSRTRLAIVTRYSDQIEIYNTDGSVVRRVTGPFGFEPRNISIAERENQLYMGPADLRFGYVGLATTDDWIYALFSGRSNNRFPPREGPYAEYVHVYDWDGEFHGVLKLDTEALAIAVDPQSEMLYATTEEPEPAVRAYRLPKTHRSQPL